MLEIFTFGHSTHSLAEFLAILAAHQIAAIADIRRFPSSRKFPQFNSAELRRALEAHDIQYQWFEALGGRRSTKALSRENAGWRVAGFHAYADYLRTPEFAAALTRLEAFAAPQRTAFMCAEALWTRCHRRLVADALTVRGWSVQHILTTKRIEPHQLPAFARVASGRLTYPAETELPGAEV